jgi:hypothetical protein
MIVANTNLEQISDWLLTLQRDEVCEMVRVGSDAQRLLQDLGPAGRDRLREAVRAHRAGFGGDSDRLAMADVILQGGDAARTHGGF